MICTETTKLEYTSDSQEKNDMYSNDPVLRELVQLPLESVRQKDCNKSSEENQLVFNAMIDREIKLSSNTDKIKNLSKQPLRLIHQFNL